MMIEPARVNKTLWYIPTYIYIHIYIEYNIIYDELVESLYLPYEAPERQVIVSAMTQMVSLNMDKIVIWKDMAHLIYR